MTNAERARRGFTTNTACILCMGQLEDIDHLLCSCIHVANIWNYFLPNEEVLRQRNLLIFDWLLKNLNDRVSCTFVDDWLVAFAVIIWWSWKWCNEAIFEGKSYTNEFKIFWLKAKVLEIDKAFRNKKAEVCLYVEKQIKWELPPWGFFVLNTDGCVKGRDKLAGAGVFYEMMMVSGSTGFHGQFGQMWCWRDWVVGSLAWLEHGLGAQCKF